MTSSIDWRRSGFPALLLTTTVLLVLGLTLPTLRMETVTSSDAHSIVGGIVALLMSGQVLLGLVILAFSVAFPLVKLIAVVLLWRKDVEDEEDKLRWLAVLGKWSMLDVYVVALFVSAVRLGILAEFQAEYGIYVFAAAILGTMLCTHRIEHLKGLKRTLRDAPHEHLRGGAWRVLSVIALVSFGAGVSLPLMEVEKWVFWSNETSLLGALGTLLDDGHALLAALLGLFVLAVPGVHLLGLLSVRCLPRLPEPALRALLALEEWAMFDVFTVALLIVAAQVGGMASITPRVGLYVLLVAALASGVDTWQLRRSVRER